MPQESARATTAHIAGRIAANHLGGGGQRYIYATLAGLAKQQKAVGRRWQHYSKGPIRL